MDQRDAEPRGDELAERRRDVGDHDDVQLHVVSRQYRSDPLTGVAFRIERDEWNSIEIASPDPHCGARLRITRLGKRRLRHADYSAVPL